MHGLISDALVAVRRCGFGKCTSSTTTHAPCLPVIESCKPSQHCFACFSGTRVCWIPSSGIRAIETGRKKEALAVAAC